ncbi:DUF11 domain-containing protein [Pseudoxanthomonas sp. YR558]|nr:DUF11 domain-containing protein [Pseudoxanthomonas sp. YR558]SFV31936.1 conserved repeat domain-containing protein [Pseudoxanthomonas sp. YR558]
MRSRAKAIRLSLAFMLAVSVVAHAATFTMPAGSNYFSGHLFSTFVGANGAAVTTGQASPLHTFTATQIGTAAGTGVISQFATGLLPTGSGYPATAPRMGEMGAANGLGVGGRIRYTFSQALPLGTHVYMQDVDQGEIATLQFYTCAGTLINPSGFDYLVAATSAVPSAAFTATAVTLTNTTGATNQNESLVAVVIRNATVCRVEYSGIFAGGTFETYFSLPPVNPGITKSVATPNPVLPSGPVSWTLTATNNALASGITGLSNPTSAYGVVISDTVNSAVTGLTAVVTNAGGTTGGSCTVGAGNAVTCSGFSPLASGQSITVTLSGTLSALYNSTSLSNTATVSNTVANDTVAANNSATSATPVTLQPNFGSCDARMFLDQVPVSTSTLFNVNYSTTPFTYTSLGSSSATTGRNGVGYNVLDNYIYGIRWPTSGGVVELIRVGADGSGLNLGVIAGLPASTYNNGVISPTGDYYLKTGFSDTTLYRINLATTPYTATTITLSQPVQTFDLAWYNGRLYGVNSTSSPSQLVSIDPVSGAVTTIGSTSPLTNALSMWGFNNMLLGSSGGVIYALDPSVGSATQLSTVNPVSSNGDGANCPSANIQFNADLSVTKTNTPASGPSDLASDTYVPGQARTYTIVVSNTSASFGAQNVRVSDPVPAGIDPATVSWTCTSTSGSAVCGVASGTGALNDTGLDLPPSAVATYLVTMTVPVGFTGTLTNTVAITPPNTINDANASNNLASDADIRGGSITIVKDAAPDSPQDFAFTTSGAGLSAFSLDDDADATLSNTRVFPGLTPGAYSVTETSVSGWSLTALTCTDPDNGTAVNLATRLATIDLDAGEDIICTYTNTALVPALAITKVSNGPWTVGQTGSTYTLNVSNVGTAATAGTITVRDQLPSGIGIRPATAFTAATGWTCSYSDEAAQNATTIVPNTGMVLTCTSSTAIAVGGVVALTIPVVVTSASPASVINYASIGGGGDAFNGGAAPTAGATCTDAAHCASATTSVTPSPPAPATCPAGGTPVNLFATPPFQSNFFLDGATETRTATLIAAAGSYTVGTGSGGRFVVNMNWRWSPGFPQPSNASTMTLRVNGVDYARITSQPGYAGYATLVALNGAALFSGTTTMETNRTSNENIWVTLPASVASVTSVQMGYTGGATGDDYFFSSPALFGCSTPVDLSVTKTNTPASGANDLPADVYVPGGARTYNVVVTNTSTSSSVLDMTVNDPVPAGVNPATVSWTCASTSGGAVCGATSGTGALNDTGLDLPPSAVATYLVTMTVPAGFSGDLANTASIIAPANITDTNTANNTATDVDQSAPLLTIRKTSVGGVDSFGFTGTNGVVTQTLVTTVAGTPVSGAAQALTAAGTATTITESTTPATYRVTDITCTGLGAGGTATPDLTNRAVVLNAAATATGANIVCTFTNTLQQADIQVVKTASPNPVVSGDVVTYTLVVSNNGPSAASNVLLTDSASAGQTCTTPSTTATCSASGGASCPSPTVPVTTLLGSGVTIPSLPAGGQVSFTLQCTVTASGQ